MMKKKADQFISSKLMRKINTQIEKELIEELEQADKETSKHKQSNKSFIMTMIIITSVVIFYKIGPIVIQLFM